MCVLPSMLSTPSACPVISVLFVSSLVCSSSAEVSDLVASIQASWLPTPFPSYLEKHAHDCHKGMHLGCGLFSFDLRLCSRALASLSCTLLCWCASDPIHSVLLRTGNVFFPILPLRRRPRPLVRSRPLLDHHGHSSSLRSIHRCPCPPGLLRCPCPLPTRASLLLLRMIRCPCPHRGLRCLCRHPTRARLSLLTM